MKRTLLIILLLCYTSNAFSVYFKQLGTKDGLSQISVMSIYQDELGRMWFGTEEGISMYDGNNIKAFKHSEDSLNTRLPIGNESFPITGDGKGNIYFRSGNILIHYDMHSEKFRCLKDKNVTTVYCHDSTTWVGAYDTIYKWNKENEKLDFYINFKQPIGLIQNIYVDSKNQLWVGTTNGLFLITKDKQSICIIPKEYISAIFEDSQNNIWIATHESGMYRRDKYGNLKKFTHDNSNPNTIPHNQVRSFAEDNFGNIWIGTFLGLCKYNPRTDKYTIFKKDDLPGSLHHTSIFSTYKDRQGTIWVGTYYGGVHYFNPEADSFAYYSDNINRNDCLSHFYVGHMVEDKNSNLWICTEGGGLNFFNRETKLFRHFTSNDKQNNRIIHNNLKCIAYSKKYNKIYIGTHTGGLSVYNIDKDHFYNFITEQPEFKKVVGDVISNIQIYKDKYLIILSRNGFFKLNMDTEKITPMLKNLPYSYNYYFYIDSKNYIWIVRYQQFLRINMNNENEVKSFSQREYNLGESRISCIYEDRKGRLFFGTLGSGLYQYDETSNSFTTYSVENNLLHGNYCYDIAQSQQGDLIVMGDKGLTFINQENESVKFVNLNDIPLTGFNKGCGLLSCQNGEIFIGGIGGMVSLYEQDLFSPEKDYDIYFSSLYVNDELITPNEKNKILKESLPYTKRLILNHKQNNLSIRFASNNYTNTLEDKNYIYRLEGFDTKWRSNSDDIITYTNLNPGKYKLTIKEEIQSPDIQAKTTSINIIIRSPWYATIWAYLLYLIIITSLLYVFLQFRKSRILLTTSLEMERKEKENIEHLNKAKLQFFSNISHEFRTPLTLIISQIERLINEHNLPPTVHNKLLKVNNNTYQLRNLISELLDFRKLEQGFVKLKVYEQDIVPFIENIYSSFNELALARNITYRFHAPEKEVLCWFDTKQMQKVFYNLLSNAFKYTKPNSSIEVVIDETINNIIVKIIDNGAGIEKKDIDRIFDRFYQADNIPEKYAQSPSTGLGLSVVKSIVELHHGQVSVESTPGYGSIFIVNLQKGSAHFNNSEITYEKTDDNILPEENETTQNESETIIYENTNASIDEEQVKRTILLVEDNEELLHILHDTFHSMYNVLLARDGKEGLNATRNEKPDLVVSDIMMPEMSGTEMCVAIKNDFETCHIPVILLTALSSMENSIEGLQCGADDYISKPFNEKALVVRCNNLIRNRIILQNKFTHQTDFNTQSLANNPIDQKFLDTVNGIIESNFENESFDINMLAQELGVSRSSLYAKFKALTGMTPNDFVLNRKLKQATYLLKNKPQMQIAEISDELGFSSPRYFSKCFKQQFNVSPAEYRKR